MGLSMGADQKYGRGPRGLMNAAGDIAKKMKRSAKKSKKGGK
tara:strand:+ start:378 stop:503 length:126 start_codon:yes stop_codon:yes gene_type:complete